MKEQDDKAPYPPLAAGGPLCPAGVCHSPRTFIVPKLLSPLYFGRTHFSLPTMPFTPINTLVGGALLHISTSSLLSDTGRVLGISGIVESGLFGLFGGGGGPNGNAPKDKDKAARGNEQSRQSSTWQRSVLLGLILAPALGSLLGLEGIYAGDALASWRGIGIGRAVLAGLLVGFGSRLGSGCTSGHFLCGVSRGSKRSLIATATFFTSALLTANLTFSPPPHAPLTPAYHPTYPSKPTRLTLFLTFAILRLAHTSLSHYLSRRGSPPTKIQKQAPYVLSGLSFGFGLLLSGMADPQKVLNFLTIGNLPTWDPSLAMVVLSGVIPNAIHWMKIAKGRSRLPWEKWSVPSRTDVDGRLIFGAAVFGVGWGLAGVCPGPAVVGLGRVLVGAVKGDAIAGVTGTVGSFVGAMVSGMALVKAL